MADYYTRDQTSSALGCLITIAFLDLEQDFSIENASEKSYIMQPEALTKIHQQLSKLDSKPLAPTLLAYGIVLHRISMRLDDDGNDESIQDAQRFTKFIDQVVGDDLSTKAEQLVQRALHLRAIETTGHLFSDSILPLSISYSITCCSLLQAILPYVTMNDTVATAIKSCMGSGPFQSISETFFADPFANKALMLSRAKVPIAISPFLKLAQALGSDAFEYLYNMTTFMQELPRSFREYEFSPDKPSIVHLTAPLDLYASREDDGAGGITLEPGASGEIISTGNSTVVMWNLKFNGWTFIGRVLEQGFILSINDGLIDDILSLINGTLTKLDEQRGLDLLDSLSEGLAPGTDIVELVTRMLDDAMYTRNIRMCVLGVDFLTALTSVAPVKVWPYIGRTKLVEQNGRVGQVANILGAVEIVQTRYDFTISFIKLANVLIRDTTATALDTKSFSQRIKSQSLTKFVRHLIDVFESFAYWRYSDSQQRVEIASLILSALTEVLYSNYRVNNTDGGITSHVLKDCCKVVTDQFLSTGEACLRTLQPLLGAIESAARSPLPLDIDNGLRQDEMAHVDASLKFCSLILRVRSLLQLPISLLEKRLFIHSPDLALIFMRYNALHASVVDLLESMISGYCHSDFDQPSLLAHLGTEYSQMLIMGLSNAIRNDLELDITIGNICNYFSAILVSQQEGLSILLLSGKDTRNTSDKVESVDSLLNVMEETIIKKNPSYSQAAQLLNCITLAHSNWNMNKNLGEKHSTAADGSTFIDSLVDRIKVCFDELASQSANEDPVDLANMYSMASKAIKVLSIDLYKNPSRNLTPIVSKLLEYSSHLLTVEGFRPSLHTHLSKNFEAKYGIPLNKFIKSDLVVSQRPYGISYLYDMWLLDSLMSGDDTWDSGYRNEVIEANVNLSLVDAQMEMVDSWCLFVTALVTVPHMDKKLLRKVAIKAVSTNTDRDSSSVPLFQGVYKRRLDLAFYILYHCGCDGISVEDLELTFGLLVDSAALVESKKYRQLVKLISLMLNPFSERLSCAENPSSTAVVKAQKQDFQLQQLVHQILDVVVIKGMRDIADAAASSKSTSSNCIEDIIQITMLLRKCLKVPGISAVYGNLTLQMADSGCDRAVMSLYSNCTESSEDGVYGELALLYLLEWLKVDNMADQFVMSGIFGVLMESPVSKIIQQGGIKPTTDPRFYAIWTNGILTMVLVLLEKLGSRIVPEMLVFLNFFALQIQSALQSWLEQSPIIGLSTINETSQIVLLVNIVTKLCEADQYVQLPKTLPSNSDLVESLDYLLTHQKYLSSRLATNAHGEPHDGMDQVVAELEDLRELVE